MKKDHKHLLKRDLINAIDNQRIILALCQEDFLKGTAKFDKGWQTLYRSRLIVGLGLGAILLKTAKKKPSRFISWPRQLVGVWSTASLVKKFFKINNKRQIEKEVYVK